MSLGDAIAPVPILRLGAAGWKLHAYPALDSTNDVARELPAWSAVTAGVQRMGRGRFGRAFASAGGGLWLSAVVPAEPPASRWAGFSLAVGLHVLRTLERIGIPEIRLRWPNDLMVGNRKLAGLLVEQGTDTTLVVGLGLNVSNRPWEQDPSLEFRAVNLVGLLSPVPEPEELATPMLDAIADAHDDLFNRGLEGVVTDLNARWVPRKVVLALHSGEQIDATFEGLDPHGNLLIESSGGRRAVLPHNQIERLSEVTE